MQAQKIKVNLINQNEYNPNEMSLTQFAKLKENIKESGHYSSLIVIKRDERYTLLDGHNRLQALKDLGKEEVWCEVWELDDRRANLILATINRLHGVDDDKKRSRLLKLLSEEFSEEELIRLLPDSKKAIESFLEMEDLEDTTEFENQILEDKLSQVVDKDVAKKLAMMGKPFESLGMRLTFEFANEDDYKRAIEYFGSYPDVRKLMELI